MKTLLCIPAFNEGKGITNLITKSFQFVDEIVVCDDGSSDNTYENAQKTNAKVLQHKKNQGKGITLKTLFDYAKKSDAEIIITMDGDGQFLPEDIPKLITPIKNDFADIVIGNRFTKDSKIPQYRKFGNKILNKITNVVSGQPIIDAQGGFRAYSKQVINVINFSAKGFAGDAEIIIDAARKGFRITEEDIKVIYNTGEKTSTLSSPSLFVNILTPLLQMIIIKYPFRFLGIPGIILTVIGISFMVMMITIFNDSRYFSIPITLIALSGIFTGLLCIFMSMLLYAIKVGAKNSSDY